MSDNHVEIRPDSYTVKIKPDVGMYRQQILGLLPDDLLCPMVETSVSVEIVHISVNYGNCDWPAQVTLMVGERGAGSYVGRGSHGTRVVMHHTVPARQGWNVIVELFDRPGGGKLVPLYQREDTDYHVVVRVTSQPSAVVKSHRWSGWPGAVCLDCGIEDPCEACIANNPKCTCAVQDESSRCQAVIPPCKEIEP